MKSTNTVGKTPAYQFKTAESFLKTVAAKKDVDVDLSKYKIGQTVSHKKFGEGIINDIEQEENDLKLDIIFEKAGHKRLMDKYANLEKKEKCGKKSPWTKSTKKCM